MTVFYWWAKKEIVRWVSGLKTQQFYFSNFFCGQDKDIGMGKDVLVIFTKKQKIINEEEKVEDAGEESDNSNLRCYI